MGYSCCNGNGFYAACHRCRVTGICTAQGGALDVYSAVWIAAGSIRVNCDAGTRYWNGCAGAPHDASNYPGKWGWCCRRWIDISSSFFRRGSCRHRRLPGSFSCWRDWLFDRGCLLFRTYPVTVTIKGESINTGGGLLIPLTHDGMLQ